MLKRITMMMVALMMMVLPIACLPKANAELAGCDGPAKQKNSTWGKVVSFSANPALNFPDVKFRLASWARYWHCPNGAGNPDLIKVTHVSFCATKYTSSDPQTLTGFKYDTYFSTLEGTASVNPPTRKLEWTGYGAYGDQRCTGHDIAVENRVWMRMPRDPAWSLDGHVALEGWPDQGYVFRDPDTGKDFRLFKPNTDPDFDGLGF